MKRNLWLTLVAISLLAVSIISIHITSVSAAKVTTSQTFKKTSFLSRSRQSVYVWNSQHTKKLANLKYYPHTNLYSTKRVVIQTNSHYGNYYYVRSANNRLKGYVWHGNLIPGSYIKGGGYRYPTEHVLLSSVPYDKKSANSSGKMETTNRIFGIMNADAIKIYTKVPTTSQQKTVINFLKRKNSNIPKMIEIGATKGVRISMMTLFIGKSQQVQLPMIETNPYGYWVDVNSFYPVLTLSKLKNRAKPIKTYNIAKTVTTVFGSRTYDFENPRAQSDSNMNEGPITKVYGTGYGPNKSLSLVDCRDRLRYVSTKNIFSISNNQPTLRHGIWYIAPSYQFVSIGGHEQKLRGMINPLRSTIYRYINQNGFTQYKYENGHWTAQFNLHFEFLKNGNVSVHFNQLTGVINHEKAVGKERVIATLTGPNADAEMMAYLNHSADWYNSLIS